MNSLITATLGRRRIRLTGVPLLIVITISSWRIGSRPAKSALRQCRCQACPGRDGQEYSLYLTVTDSRGTRVTSERIPVRVTQDETSFRSWINVINDDVQVEDGNFVINTPLPAGEEGKVIEWHYVRERSEEEWASLKPRHIKYQSDTPGLALDDKHPVKGTVLLQAQSDSIAQKVTSVEVLFTPGTEEANGSVTAPVVGTEMRARTLCVNNTDCTDAFNYQWEISDEMKSWQSVPGATKATWLLPYSLNGESLQNKYIRVRIISDKDNVRGNRRDVFSSYGAERWAQAWNTSR